GAPYLHIDVAWPASLATIAALAALVLAPARVRVALVALNAALGGYLFFRADSFWGLVACALIFVWALIGLLPVMDGAWRFKTGLAFCSFLAAMLVLWPTIDRATEGKTRCPQYVKDRITFGIAPGLDVRGGMRLVYT